MLGFWMYCEHYKIQGITRRNVSLGPTRQTKNVCQEPLSVYKHLVSYAAISILLYT